jgi:Mg-chelatase subunit ChlD
MGGWRTSSRVPLCLSGYLRVSIFGWLLAQLQNGSLCTPSRASCGHHGVPAITQQTFHTASAEGGRSIELILDASGSMRAHLPDGKLKIDSAKAAVAQLLGTLPADTRLAFRAYGHQSPESAKNCQDTALLNGFDSVANAKASIVANANGLDPRGYTPITYVLQLAAQDLVQEEGREHAVVLVSDGKETCQSDPCAAAKALADSDSKLVIHTIGAGVDNETRTQLECIAKAGRGKYFDAKDGTQLTTVMAEAAVTKAQPIAEETVKKAEISPKKGSIDIKSPTALDIGEVVKGRLARSDKTGEYQYWKITLPAGKYLLVYDVREADDTDPWGAAVSSVKPDGTVIKELVAMGFLGERRGRATEIIETTGEELLLRIDGGKAITDYWLALMPGDAEVTTPYFGQNPSVTALELGKTYQWSTDSGEKMRETWFSTNLNAGDYKVEVASDNIKTGGLSSIYLKMHGSLGEHIERNGVICDIAGWAGKQGKCDSKLVVARDGRVFLQFAPGPHGGAARGTIKITPMNND